MNTSLNATADQAQFKADVRAKLKKHGKSFKWLALNIGKSEGSVKNWLYTNLNITVTNARKIEEVINRLEHGDRTLKSTIPGQSIRYLTFKSSSPYRETSFWCMAAGIPTSIYSENSNESTTPDAEQLKSLATWATDTVLKSTKSIIRPLYLEAKAKGVDAIAKLLSSGKEGEYVPVDEPFITSLTWVKVNENNNEEYIYALPVYPDRWDSTCINIAASSVGKSTIAWVTDILTEAAIPITEAYLDAFLDLPDEQSTEEDETDNDNNDDDDDIPF